MSCGIYKITNNITGKVYVGCSAKIEKRWSQHQKGKESYISKAIVKYGLDNFSFDIIITCPVFCFDYWEKHYVNLYNSVSPNGYNLTSGGQEKYEVTKVSRKKMSDAKIGVSIPKEVREKMKNSLKQRTFSEEHRKKISETLKGRTLSEETKQKVSISKSGKKLSKEHRKKISESNIGRIFSKESCEKISEALKGRVFSEETKLKWSEKRKGKAPSEETKKKISLALKQYKERMKNVQG